MLTIRPMADADADPVLAIYQHRIDTGNATFDTTAPTWAAFNAGRLPEHRLVACDEAGQLLGWVAVSRVSQRPAYAGVVEHSVYVHPQARGRSVGLALHRAVGFREIGVRQRPGCLHGRWRDVVAIERRSTVVGTTPG